MATDIETIKSRLDIVDIVGSYIDLKRAGSNYKAPCPFHNEKTASFMVNPTLQIYKCFGCGKGGDVINFIQEMEKADFKEALHIAAEKAGIELNDSNLKEDKELKAKKIKLLKANELTANFYHYILQTHKLGERGRAYAQKRGLNGELIQKFLFGYAPNSKNSLKGYLLKKGFNEKELVNFGLLVERYDGTIDKYRNRLMQPVFDLRGNIVGFSGRYIGISDKAPKYLNSPETLVFKKNELLYGMYQSLNAIRQVKSVILVEGNLDVVSPHKIGVENIVAPLGTAFTEGQAKLLKRYVDMVYFCFDSDSAGTNSLVRSLQILENIGLRHKVLNLGKYKDPDEVVNKEPKLFPEIIKNALSTVGYLFDVFAKGLDLGDPDDKISYRNKIIPILKMLKDDVELNHYIREASIILEVPQEDVAKMVSKSETKNRPRSEKPEEVADVEEIHIGSLENYFLALMIQNEKFDLDWELDVLANENTKKLVRYLMNSKRKLSDEEINKLEKPLIHIYKDALIFDLSEVTDFNLELINIYSRLKLNYLKAEILKLRKALAINEEDVESIGKLNHLIQELKGKG